MDMPVVRYNLEDSLDSLKKLISEITDIQVNINKNYTSLADEDLRNVVYSFLIEGIQMYVLSEMLSEELLKLEWWKKRFKSISDEETQVMAQGKVLHFLDWTKLNFFLRTFIEIETFLNLLVANYNPRLEGSGITATVKNLISDLNINPQFVEIWKVLAYSRNTIHNGGYHNRASCTIQYQGHSFNFIDKQPITFMNLGNAIFILSENIRMINDICLAYQIKQIPYIKHPYFDIQFKK